MTATDGATITVDWTATTDTYATGHRVFRATSSGGPYTQIAEVTPQTTTTYVDSPAPGTYYYVVQAVAGTWTSVNSNEAVGSAVPPNPGNSVNCSDFTTQAEAQAWFDFYYPWYGDVAFLDSDNDLIACESLP